MKSPHFQILTAYGTFSRKSITSEIARIRSYQSRIQTALSNLQQSFENYELASSRIKDADVGFESANVLKIQILQQGAAALLAQANILPQLMLSLIRI